MALFIPQKGDMLINHNTGTVGSATFGTAVTTGTPSSTKGTAVELISAANNTFDTYMIAIMACNYALSATASEGMLDILIGAATEEVLIPNLLMGNSRGESIGAAIPSGLGKSWLFPLYIPAGTRIAAQAAGARTNATFHVSVFLFGGNAMPPFKVGSKVTTYPTAPSVPRGDPITPGASGAEGSWQEVVASTTEDHFAVLPSFQSETDTTISERAYQLDIGIGAATEEQIGSYWFGSGTGDIMDGPFPPLPIFKHIPSGTRLATRCSASGTLDTAYGVMLHCIS